MKKVMISGCFDILHGGHIEFFSQAKALGDYLVVSFANDQVLMKYKGRKSAIPTEHKKRIIESLNMVNEVVIGDSIEFEGLDFINHFSVVQPNILVATEDDKFKEEKQRLCATASWGCKYVVLEKSLNFEKISTTEIIEWIKSPKEVPLRVDFAGGWLDVPKHAMADAFIVNCSISPLVSLNAWGYEIGGGLGGSAAYAILSGKNGVSSELNIGVGWQDPAVIKETGLCVWRSGKLPILDSKYNPEWLNGRMAILWSRTPHKTFEFTDYHRDYDLIKQAGIIAKKAVYLKSISLLSDAINLSYTAQLKEGMNKLNDYGLAHKYCGGGFGGYALYLFADSVSREKFIKEHNAISIEPFINHISGK